MQEVACSVVTSGDDCWVRLTDGKSGRSPKYLYWIETSTSLQHLHMCRLRQMFEGSLFCAGDLFAECPIVKDKPLTAVRQKACDCHGVGLKAMIDSLHNTTAWKDIGSVHARVGVGACQCRVWHSQWQ